MHWTACQRTASDFSGDNYLAKALHHPLDALLRGELGIAAAVGLRDAPAFPGNGLPSAVEFRLQPHKPVTQVNRAPPRTQQLPSNFRQDGFLDRLLGGRAEG